MAVVCLCAGIANGICQPLSWQQIKGPYGGAVWAMVASQASGRMWTGNGFYTSDNGATWTPKGSGISSGSPTSHFAMAINDDGYLFSGNFTGGYRSTDGGDNWLPMFLPGSPSIISLATHGDDVWAGSYQGKIYHSTDNGNSWSVAHDGSSFSTDVYALAAVGSTVYAGTYGNGVMKSADNGANWEPRTTGLSGSGVISMSLIDPNSTASLFAGLGDINYSSNGGSSWTIVASISASVYGFAHNIQNGYFYAVTSKGFMRADNTSNWSLSNNGLTTLDLRSIAVDQTTGTIFVGTNSDGVFRSTDNGTSWTHVGTPVAVFALASSGGQMFAGTNDSIFSSSNNGVSWVQANTNISSSICNTLLSDPANGRMLAGTRDGLYLSQDNGTTWTAKNTGLTDPWIKGIIKRSNSYAVWLTVGFFTTPDLGETWVPMNAGLLDSTVTAAVYDTAGYVFVGTLNEGVFRHDGLIWQQKNEGLFPGNITSMAFNPTTGSVFVGMTGFGIYRSTDHGATWTESNNSIVSSVSQMIVAPNGTIFAATLGDGVYYSTNDGATWSYSNTGLASLTIYTLALDNNGFLWAGTLDGGVYRSATAFSGVKHADASKPSMRVYPNPVVENLFIETDEAGMLDMFDPLGNKVATYDLSAGKSGIPIEGFPAGSYLLRLSVGGTTTTASIVVVR